MIRLYENEKLKKKESLLEALRLKNVAHPVIMLTGAGGKTAAIARLAKEYQFQHIPVIITTTTHMMDEKTAWMLTEPSMDKAAELLRTQGRVLAGTPCAGGKIKMPEDSFFHQLIKEEYPVLIEADGAKRLPLKVPAEHEPVLVKEATHILNVYGMDAVGEKLSRVCFRPELASKILRCSEEHVVTEEDIALLAMKFKEEKLKEYKDCCYYVILNKADGPEEEEKALKICRLMDAESMAGIIITGRG